MSEALTFLTDHAVFVWLALGALLLVAELATGSGYLLWPAGSAGAVAIITLVLRLNEIGQVVLFSALTIAATYAGRRWLPRRPAADPNNLNDKATRLVGRPGFVSAPFDRHGGRVFVDGAEWSATVGSGVAPPALNDPVTVVEVHGSRLTVRAA